MIPTSMLLLVIVLFVVWNSCPSLIETVGTFFCAQAKSIRSRDKYFETLTSEFGKVK